MTDRELMQQALHTLEGWANHGEWVWPESALEQAKRNTTESIAALRERLAQPEQEPVVWMYQDKSTHEVRFQKHMREFVDHGATYETPLYTTPPRREWEGLTEEEIARREKVKPILVRIMQEAYDLADRDDSEGYNSVKVMCSDVLAMINKLLDERQWQGLTDDDIAQAMYRADAIITGPMQFKFAREIEAKLKEKNT